MNDKKTITVEIPILDNVEELKVVETFTEEQLWYVCAIAKAFEKTQSNWNSLRELIEKEIINTKKCIEFNIKNNLDYSEYKRDIVRFEFILDKMNELEGKDKE